ncbi:MAG: hypothetical protein RLZZ444_3911 [Pseudomonadota bacterium]
MLPNLRQLSYFTVVAETLNFREASVRLNIAQPAISRAIRELEDALGCKLFERTTRNVRLTPEGAALAEGTRKAWRELDIAVRHMKQVSAGNAGDVVIGYSAQAAHGPMSKLLLLFKATHPDISIKLRLLSSEEQAAELSSGGIDLGFFLSAAVKSGLDHFPIAEESFVVLLPSFHPLAQRHAIDLLELREEPFVIGTPERWRTFRSLIEGACLQAGFLPEVVGSADDVPLLLEMVASGQGVTLYGSSIVPTMPPGLAAVPTTANVASFHISLAWKRQQLLPAAARLVAFAQSQQEGPFRR